MRNSKILLVALCLVLLFSTVYSFSFKNIAKNGRVSEMFCMRDPVTGECHAFGALADDEGPSDADRLTNVCVRDPTTNECAFTMSDLVQLYSAARKIFNKKLTNVCVRDPVTNECEGESKPKSDFFFKKSRKGVSKVCVKDPVTNECETSNSNNSLADFVEFLSEIEKICELDPVTGECKTPVIKPKPTPGNPGVDKTGGKFGTKVKQALKQMFKLSKFW